MLNRPESSEPADPNPSDDIDINTGTPYQADAETAIKTMKNDKDLGIDSLQAELLKAYSTTASMVHVLTDLFAKIWNQDWSKGRGCAEHIFSLRNIWTVSWMAERIVHQHY